MSFKISNSVKCLTALVLVSACNASNAPTPTPTPPPPPTPTALNFNTTTTPASSQSSVTATNLLAANAVTQAQYNLASDAVTLTRSGAPSLTLTGSDANHPSNNNLDAYQVTGAPEQGTVVVAHTSNGDGYAVAFFDNSTSTSLDPQISALSGGTSSTAGTPSAIAGATFNGAYLGYASQSLGGFGTPASGSVTGDATLQINATGNGILPGTVVSNRQTGASGSVASITTTGGPINGNLQFNAIPLATTGLLGQTATGTMDGAFYEASAGNPDGEVIGTVLLQGGNAACIGSGNITTVGASCVVEAGTFVAD